MTKIAQVYETEAKVNRAPQGDQSTNACVKLAGPAASRWSKGTFRLIVAIISSQHRILERMGDQAVNIAHKLPDPLISTANGLKRLRGSADHGHRNTPQVRGGPRTRS